MKDGWYAFRNPNGFDGPYTWVYEIRDGRIVGESLTIQQFLHQGYTIESVVVMTEEEYEKAITDAEDRGYEKGYIDSDYANDE